MLFHRLLFLLFGHRRMYCSLHGLGCRHDRDNRLFRLHYGCRCGSRCFLNGQRLVQCLQGLKFRLRLLRRIRGRLRQLCLFFYQF